MRVLSAEETAQLLPYPELAQALESIMRADGEGRTLAPPRLAVPLAKEGMLLVMPATDDQLTVTKIVTVHPENAAGGLATVQAEVVVMETETGRRLAVLEGQTVTARRTAALSLLAASRVAPDPTGPMLIIGAGVQGRSHLEAFCQGLGVKEVYVTSRTVAGAKRLEERARELGLAAQLITNPDEVLDRVRLIVTATTSVRPVLSDRVREDAFIAAIGAYRPDMAELPASLIGRAQVYVDTLDGAQAEAGELIQANVDWHRVRTLGAVLDEPRPERGPVVFKSVGSALWDLAAAHLAVSG
jgi:ornithine cyclodeaminase